jgi:hypothetical protein
MDELKDQLRRRREEVRLDPGAFERLASRRRRRDAVRRGTVIAVAFSISIGGAALFLQAFGGERSPVASVSPTPTGIVSPPAASLLNGTWSATLTDAMPGVRAQHLAGTYRLTFGSGGSLKLHIPAGAIPGARRAARGSFRIAGGGFEIAADVLADACDGSTGTYSWNEHVGSLAFAVVSDPCSVRRTVLTSQGWSSA